MIFEFVDKPQIGMISFEGDYSIPVWAFTYFLDKVNSNYMKLVYAQRICELLDKGAEDDQLSVVTYSADIIPRNTFRETDYRGNVVDYAGKSSSPERFWDIIKRSKRPIVLFKEGGHNMPLFDFDSEEAIKLKNITLQSPPAGEIIGTIGILIELFLAGEAEKRNRLEHEARVVGLAIENTNRMAVLEHNINDLTLPQGYRIYASNMRDALITKQAELNAKIGLNVTKIDEAI